MFIPKFESLADRKIQFKEYWVQGRDNTEILLKYKDIDYDNGCKIDDAPEIEESKLEGQNYKCCL